MCLCGHNESKDCIVCSTCMQRFLMLMHEGKLEDAIQVAVDRGLEEKAKYLNEVKKEMIEDGRESKRPTRRVPKRGPSVRISRSEKDKFRQSAKVRRTSVRKSQPEQQTIFGK